MNGENNLNPLVSIIVITYNSAKYVMETLESTKAQTYKNIELIISDDCSTDNTVEICRNWLENNENYFFNSTLIQASKNTGIPSNVNRGVYSAKGEWIKLIAGDDILLDNCISDNISFIQKKPNSYFIFSKPIYVNQESKILNDSDTRNFKKFKEYDFFYTLSARRQYLHLLTQDHPINPPTLFYKKLTLDNLGGFDENFNIEDFPLYLKITKAGHKIYFNNVNTIKYRIHDLSFSQELRDNNAISNWNLKKLKTIIFPHVNTTLFFNAPLIVIDIYNKLIFYNLVILLGNTNSILRSLSFIRWFSPILIFRKFNQRKFNNS